MMVMNQLIHKWRFVESSRFYHFVLEVLSFLPIFVVTNISDHYEQ